MVYVVLTIFILALVVKLIFKDANIPIHYLTTPIVTSCSIFAALLGLSEGYSFFGLLAILIVVFCLIGDMFLMFKSEKSLLLYGLGFFSVAHIIVIVTTYLMSVVTIMSVAMFIILIIIMADIYVNFKVSGFMKYAVMIYMLLGTFSVTFALTILLSNFNLLNALLALGVSLWYISDIILGINKFWKPIKNSYAWIWATYAPGVLLIAYSLSNRG